MIRRRSEDGWEVVRQPAHGALAAALLDAIGDRPQGPAEAVRVAVAHHDDGWAVRDATVREGPDGGPETFLDLPLRDHLALSDASVTAVAARDPYAGAVVARHVAWLHGGRPVDDPAVAAERDALVARWRAVAVDGAAVADDAALAHDQRLCALVDLLSLWLCGWPDGDLLTVERPDGTQVECVRTGDRIRIPVTMLPARAAVTVEVADVAAAAPFAVRDTVERTLTLEPV